MPRRYLLGFAGALALFLALRLLLLWRFPPFYDEVLYAALSTTGAADPAQRFISMTIGYAPLLTWGGMVGIWAGLAPLTAVRVISLLSGLTTFTLTGLIGRELGGIRTALVACTLVAITPFLVVHDVIGIYDPLCRSHGHSSLVLADQACASADACRSDAARHRAWCWRSDQANDLPGHRASAI